MANARIAPSRQLNINSINKNIAKFDNLQQAISKSKRKNKEKYIAAIWREKSVRDALKKISKTQKSQRYILGKANTFSNQEVEQLNNIFQLLIDKSGNIKSRPERRLTIDEMKLLIRFQRELVKQISENLKNTEKASFRDLFNFMNDNGKKNEASIIGKTIKESKFITLPVTLISTTILSIMTLLGATFTPYILLGLSIIALGVFCYKIGKRFCEKNGYFESDKDILCLKEIEEDKNQVKVHDIFDVENKVGSHHQIKVASKLQDLIITNIYEETQSFIQVIKNINKTMETFIDKANRFGVKEKPLKSFINKVHLQGLQSAF
jgi:hypothetical protein